MEKFMAEMRHDGSYHKAAVKVFADEVSVDIYDSPDPRSIEASGRERMFYGARRTVSLRVSWEDGEPKVTVNGEVYENRFIKPGEEGLPNLQTDQTWPIWTLSGGDIEGVYKNRGGKEHYGLPYSELDLDQVARSFLKAIESLLGIGYDWTDILAEAIKENTG